MDVLLTYDVNTQTVEGERRLRKVAKICEGYGRRVQYSVFEMVVTEVQMVRLKSALSGIITGRDSIRVYRLEGAAFDHVETLGRRAMIDHRDPWIV